MHDSDVDEQNGSIHFLLNGEFIGVNNVEPTTSVLNYLREHRALTGTKEGCAEGDCGACTVVIAELLNGQVTIKAVNACIQFLPTLDGKAVFTVEYLRGMNGALHPVQQSMVDFHGSQCGFCTPGFVMSLWSLYVQHQQAETTPEDAETRSALTGNLCRCTGYRPILEAASNMFKLPLVKFDMLGLRQNLMELQTESSLCYEYMDQWFFAPKTLEELIQLRAEEPDATLLSGGTDVGLWVNKQFRDINPVVYIGQVEELKKIDLTEEGIRIGAGASLTDSYKAVSQLYPEMDQLWERFASLPIRNIGTLGGNIANGSPIGDTMPALIVLGAKVKLCSEGNRREILLEDLYVDYMKKSMNENEIVESILIPSPSEGLQFRCYKLSKRRDSDISSVFAAFALTLNGEKVDKVKIAYGGMAATPKRATRTEQLIAKLGWNEKSLQQAMEMLTQDYTPMTDMRASANNRSVSAKNLLYRFYLETRPHNPMSQDSVSVFDVSLEARK